MYFSKFPLVTYRFVDKDNVIRNKLATNILKRVAFTDSSMKSKDLFITYNIKDGEKPETIADKIYGDPEYHWAVLLFNDIIDPYRDWPLGSYEIDRYVEKKYFGTSLFLSHENGNDHPSTIDFHKNQTVANSAGWRDNYGVYSVGPKRGRVIGWDSKYSRLDIDKTENNPSDFSVGDYIVGVGSTGQAAIARIQRITFRSEGVHHFEVQEGLEETADYLELNPLASSRISGQVPMGATGMTFGSGSTGAGEYRDKSPQFGETLVGSYMGVCGADNNDDVITNRVYEYRLNDEKKKIKLLDPQYVAAAELELEKLLKVRGLIT